MARKKKIYPVKIILGIFLVFIVLFSLFFWVKYKDCLKYGVNLCLTAKEYHSAKVPLSFKYPSYFPFSEPSEEWWEWDNKIAWNYKEVFDFAPEFYMNAGGERLGSIRISTASGSENIDDLAKDLSTPKEITLGNGAGSWNVIQKPSKVEKVIIGNNINALKVSEIDSKNMLSEPGTEFIFFKDGMKYSITFYYNDYHHKRPKSDYEKGFNLILGTFKVEN